MEAGLFLAVLLLACTPLHTSPTSADECKFLPSTQDKLLYKTSQALSGCVSRSSMEGQQEVHVLQVKIKEMQRFHLNVSSAGRTSLPKRAVLFVIVCNESCEVLVHSEESDLTFASDIHVSTLVNNVLVTEKVNYTSDKPIVQQVKDHYKGITSFTELENPYHIYFRLGEDASSPEDCIVQPGFSASQYLQAEFLVPKVKHCKNPHAQKLKEAHILHMKQAPKETSFQPGTVKVKVNVVCPEAKLLQDLEILLILQSQENVTWRVDMKNNGAILTRGKYWLSTFPDMQMNGRALPDNEEGLTGLAHEKDFGDVAFYRDIPSASHLTIELHRCGAEATPTTPTLIHTPPMQDLQDILIQAYVSLNTPWKCTDDTMEIAVPRSTEYLKEDITAITLRDTGCKAEPNKTHFVLKRYLGDCNTTLESEAKASNKLILTLAASMKKVEVEFSCELPQEPQLQLYQTQDFKWPSTTVLQVNKTAYVQISFRSSNAQTNLMVKECSVQVATQEPQRLLLSPGASHGKAVTILPPKEATLGRELHQFSLVYTPAGGRPLPPCATLVCTLTNGSTTAEASLKVTLQDTPAQSLGIEAVVGITFAAFLIGTLLTAALWCIYTHTRPMAKMQPVSSTTPASESSSTNHSIGSTQSTPCSTSSTA